MATAVHAPESGCRDGSELVVLAAARRNEAMARFLLSSGVQSQARCLAKEHSVNARVVLVALSLASSSLVVTLANEWARPAAVQEETFGMAVETPSSLPRAIASLPTVTPREEPAPRADFAAAALPSLEPQPAVASLPAVAPTPEPKEPEEPERKGCDPAYPDERTCIPPGPPFDQGCAITSERKFKVLPPDPQRLDHDGDGIGCEPIGAST